MINPAIRQSFGVVLMMCLSYSSFSQNLRGFTQDASTNNRISPGAIPGIVVRINGDRTSPHSDSIATRGSFLPSMSATIYSGTWGLSGEYGSFNSSPHFNIADFTQNIKSFSVNDITSTQWKSWFLLFGPSFRTAIGQSPFVFSADILAGAMKMTPASFTVSDAQDGTIYADYYKRSKQSTASQNALFAYKPSARLEYFPGNGGIGINIHASYLQATGAQEVTMYYRDLSTIKRDGVSQQEVRAQAMKAPLLASSTKGPVQNFSFGAGISIQIGSGKGITEKGIKRSASSRMITPPRDQGSEKGITEKGIKRTAANQMVTTPRDHGSGVPTGKRDTEKMAIKENGLPGKPVSTKSDLIISPRDPSSGMPAGRVLPTVNKVDIAADQTSRLSASKIVHRDLAARNVIAGKLYWSAGSDGIITNKTGRSRGHGSIGTMVVLAARDAGSGMATGKRGREAGSGMATGRREYQAFYTDGDNTGTNNIQGVSSNPLYQGQQNTHENPLYQGRTTVQDNPLYEGQENVQDNPLYEGIGDIFVSILNAVSGETISTTRTEKNGEFFFANVPDGNYKVEISGIYLSKKGYDMYAPLDMQLAGSVKANEETVQLDLSTYRQDSQNEKATVNTSRSNIKHSSKTIKTYFEAGDKPTAEQAARPGNPIGGIIVKGGKNPGGNMRTVTTDEHGEFEFGTLEAGRYTISVEYAIQLEDETTISAGE